MFGRKTLGDILATFTKVQADLETLQKDNAAEVTKNEAAIATLAATNAERVKEAANAAAVAANIKALLTVKAS